MPQCTPPQHGTGVQERGEDKEGQQRRHTKTPEERGDKDRRGTEVLMARRRGKRRRWQIRKGGRRKERRSSEVMEILYGGLVS